MEPAGSVRKVLVVDDSATAAAVVTRALQPLGLQVTVVPDGEAALRAISAEQPDLVIADVIMPRMNGFELCRALRADARFADLPIIVVTAMDTEVDRYWGFKQGIDEFLTKPIDPAVLVATVRAYL